MPDRSEKYTNGAPTAEAKPVVDRSAAAKKAQASRTPEQRSAAARKAVETMRKNGTLGKKTKPATKPKAKPPATPKTPAKAKPKTAPARKPAAKKAATTKEVVA